MPETIPLGRRLRIDRDHIVITVTSVNSEISAVSSMQAYMW